ncbi:MAG TPA: 6-carboxytetrahydropterin synthase [Thermodesulfobacteriota bacterium]|nr:6-carboxytetrahydropterin synthase [Thermodesulfobacteriota bacterium]
MYTIGSTRAFAARHFLTGGDWGEENRPHTHQYRIEVEVRGEELDAHGYLVDLTTIDRLLEDQAGRYSGALLNDLPEFAGKNPSIENLATILARALLPSVVGKGIAGIRVKLWENDQAWAAYEQSVEDIDNR